MKYGIVEKALSKFLNRELTTEENHLLHFLSVGNQEIYLGFFREDRLKEELTKVFNSNQDKIKKQLQEKLNSIN